jgi:hypothetical protein
MEEILLPNLTELKKKIRAGNFRDDLRIRHESNAELVG